MKKTLIIGWVTVAAITAFTARSSIAQQVGREEPAHAAKPATATITFIRVPSPALKPGPEGMETIAGKVGGVVFHDCRVVVYALGDVWYVQPQTAAPLTDIYPDGKWETDTHGGTQYAALLVKSSFRPRPTVATLPQVGDDVLAVVRAKPGFPLKTITFSGYEWTVKSSDRRVGPGHNYFSDSTDNVSVDGQGRLHLRIVNRDKEWYCAEVISKESFGYGTYRFYLDSSVDDLDPNVILGLFTWSDDSAYSHREIDIECSKWMDAKGNTTAQFVVQPYKARDHLLRFELPLGLSATTYSFTWKSDRISFCALRGHAATPVEAGSVIREWAFGPEGVPRPGGEQARMNLWLMRGREPKGSQAAEVIIKKFEFIRAE